ncbi:uncharacterized protein I206_103797 [Kwoniella pini CBS 10737]|uniref:Uncharacterized protein n=1 Tax=Kwoniella pini CBS 10737 TaxID=1296096 RepID=A0A1B9HSL3_9TREE|nr:uncharacterized protein I206_07746 [Kwoniella pini CBS 10737]OCF46269.1 hypothetical protein I206_07746 [Kwoniella pini CBS 10737]
MNESMDIDLSLDEIIAKKRSQERVERREERKVIPYSRPQSRIPTGPRNNSKSLNENKGLRSTLSSLDIKQQFHDIYSPIPLQPTSDNLKRPCRELSIGIFTKDITPIQIKDLIQSVIGPVQELRLDSNGIAWVRMLRWQGWEVYSFLHGKVLDGSQRLQVRVYPLRAIPAGSKNTHRRTSR